MKLKILYKGIFYTSIASIFWGIPQPIFFNQLKFVPTLEVVSHRSIWSFIILFFTLTFIGKINEFFNIFQNKKKIFYLSITGFLILINWTGFILAIDLNRLQDASMGYYISPIVSIILGYFFLNEKISKLKIISISLMITSIIFLVLSVKTFPFLALLIALSWSFYGLLRKKISVSSEIGLLFESGFISFFAIFYVTYLHFIGQSHFLGSGLQVSVLLFFTGVITVLPLFFFNSGIKFVPLGLAGVIFYLTPTFHFMTSIIIFKEELNIYKLVTFIIIWIAVIIFIYDNINIKEKKINGNNTQLPN